MPGDETSGIPVAELYRRRILDDPEVRDLAVKAGETSLSVPSGWRNLRLEPYKPERRAGCTTTRSSFLHHGSSYRPTVPRGHRASHVMVALTGEEQAKKALHDVMMKRLNGMLAELRSGELVVEGIKEPPSHDLARGRVAAGFWLRSSVRVNFESGLLGDRRGKTIVIFSDLRVIEAPGSSKHDGQGSKSSAVKDCEQWLREQGEAPTMPKDGYWQIAKKRFKGLSQRGFFQAWANAVGNNSRWTSPGRKPKAPKA